MKKAMLKRISPKPFEAMGFTLDEYIKWCDKHNLPAYKIETKRKFFNLVDAYVIVKRNGKFLEHGDEL